jgi:hypothetical protein
VAEFEEPPSPTRRDAGETTRDEGSVPPPRAPYINLPGGLGERFRVLRELPVQGAESDLLHVAAGDGREYVVKVFRRGYRADPDVWRTLPALDSPHVLRILETGHADGRDYEISGFLPGGNLRNLLGDLPLPPELVTQVAGQLADGLATLHTAGIVHRDLKPENVLIAETAPLRLVIADFGLSRMLDQSVVFASSSRTLAYAAPESLSGQVSPARDWWSLGMIVRELATARRPFEGLSETVVVDHLATRGVDNSDVPDVRLRLLCQGLLTRDPRRRWGAEQVREWLAGGAPQVAEETDNLSGLPFRGQRYADRTALAGALVEHWAEAARYFFGRGEGSEAWRLLRTWLLEFPDDDRIELVDGRLTGAQPPDVKLMHLIRWLDPALPPYLFGRRITPADLPGLVALAGDPGHPEHDVAVRIGHALWTHRLLPELGEADLDRRWRQRADEWARLAAGLRPHLPPHAARRLSDAGGTGDDPPVVLLTLLALAARPGETAERLAAAAAQSAARMPSLIGPVEPKPGRPSGAPGPGSVGGPGSAAGPGAVAWFGWLVEGAGGDPLRLLAVVRTAPDAVAEAEAGVRERAAEQRRIAEQAEQWAERERVRLERSGAATVRAVLWSLPILVIWLAGSWLVDGLFGDHGSTASVGTSQGAKGIGPAVLIAASVVAWAVQCGAEVALARQQGGDYLPYGPWSWLSKVLGIGGRGLAKASSMVSGTAQRQTQRGCGFMLVAGLVPLLLLLLVFSVLTALAEFFWLLLLISVPLAHAAGAGLRYHRWRQGRSAG